MSGTPKVRPGQILQGALFEEPMRVVTVRTDGGRSVKFDTPSSEERGSFVGRGRKDCTELLVAGTAGTAGEPAARGDA